MRFSRPDFQKQWWAKATSGMRGVSSLHEEVTSFLVRQWFDMRWPSNFLLSDPQGLQETLRTGGANVASGAVTKR